MTFLSLNSSHKNASAATAILPATGNGNLQTSFVLQPTKKCKLPPLVLFTILDHYTRCEAPPVEFTMGLLLGSRKRISTSSSSHIDGVEVEVKDSFPLKYILEKKGGKEKKKKTKDASKKASKKSSSSNKRRKDLEGEEEVEEEEEEEEEVDGEGGDNEDEEEGNPADVEEKGSKSIASLSPLFNHDYISERLGLSQRLDSTLEIVGFYLISDSKLSPPSQGGDLDRWWPAWVEEIYEHVQGECGDFQGVFVAVDLARLAKGSDEDEVEELGCPAFPVFSFVGAPSKFRGGQLTHHRHFLPVELEVVDSLKGSDRIAFEYLENEMSQATLTEDSLEGGNGNPSDMAALLGELEVVKGRIEEMLNFVSSIVDEDEAVTNQEEGEIVRSASERQIGKKILGDLAVLSSLLVTMEEVERAEDGNEVGAGGEGSLQFKGIVEKEVKDLQMLKKLCEAGARQLEISNHFLNRL